MVMARFESRWLCPPRPGKHTNLCSPDPGLDLLQPHLEFFGADRPALEEALHVLGSDAFEEGVLFGGFDSLEHRGESQVSAQGEDTVQHHRESGFADAVDDALVELDHGDGEPCEGLHLGEVAVHVVDGEQQPSGRDELCCVGGRAIRCGVQ